MQHLHSPAGRCCALGLERGWCAGHSPLPWSIKDDSEEDAALQPAHWRLILGMPNAAALPSLPEGSQNRRGRCRQEVPALQATLPALPQATRGWCQEGILGGDTRQKWQRAEAGAIKFDGIRAFNCSTSHTCHTGSSLATGTKKNTVKKRSISCHLPHQQFRQVLLLSTLGQCWLLTFSPLQFSDPRP